MRIGIDLGGTKIEGIAMDAEGRVICRRRIATPREDYEATLRAIAHLTDHLEDEARARTGIQSPARIGIGMPGSISPHSGLVRNANSTWLNGRPFDRDIEEVLNRPVRIANDANCFALSEARDGAGARGAIVFGVILGTGVGGGLVVNGEALLGANRISGEWGHMPLPDQTADEVPGPVCYCGRHGCMETWVSGPAMAADYRMLTGLEPGPTPPEIVRRAMEGEAAAQHCFQRFVDRLARGLAVVVNIVDPDVIVLGGGLSNIDVLYDVLPDAMRPHVFSDTIVTEIVPAAHGDSSGVRGAAWLWPAIETEMSEGEGWRQEASARPPVIETELDGEAYVQRSIIQEADEAWERRQREREAHRAAIPVTRAWTPPNTPSYTPPHTPQYTSPAREPAPTPMPVYRRESYRYARPPRQNLRPVRLVDLARNGAATPPGRPVSQDFYGAREEYVRLLGEEGRSSRGARSTTQTASRARKPLNGVAYEDRAFEKRLSWKWLSGKQARNKAEASRQAPEPYRKSSEERQRRALIDTLDRRSNEDLGLTHVPPPPAPLEPDWSLIEAERRRSAATRQRIDVDRYREARLEADEERLEEERRLLSLRRRHDYVRKTLERERAEAARSRQRSLAPSVPRQTVERGPQTVAARPPARWEREEASYEPRLGQAVARSHEPRNTAASVRTPSPRTAPLNGARTDDPYGYLEEYEKNRAATAPLARIENGSDRAGRWRSHSVTDTGETAQTTEERAPEPTAFGADAGQGRKRARAFWNEARSRPAPALDRQRRSVNADDDDDTLAFRRGRAW
ncbi:MAG: ROK family protein [Pseudomonadota bacterium]